MASISSTSSSSSATSIYGTRNVISGLASGMDTEQLIENAVSAYKTKITSLSQKRTKVEWQQEAYRSIVTKMAGFTSKYADYQSSTNLMSASFFNQAMKTVAQGANASKVSATGKTSSNIQINSVKQLAQAATYRIGGGAVGNRTGVNTTVDGFTQVTADGSFNLSEMRDVSTVSGEMTIAYGGSDARSYLTVNFDELQVFDSPEDMAAEINKQLANQTITTSSGTSVKASTMLKAKVEDGTITFESKGGNSAYISDVTGKIKDTMDINTGKDSDNKVISMKVKDGAQLKSQVNTGEYLSHATMSITLDGVTKKIQMPEAGETDPDKYIEALQQKIDDAFGTVTDKNGNQVSKLKVENASQDGNIKLQFTAQQVGSNFSVTSDKAAAMGITNSDKTLNSSFDTSKTLADLLGTNEQGELLGVEGIGTGEDRLYSFKVNGVEIGRFTKDTTLSEVMSKINGNKEAGVNVSYSKTTNEFTFTAKETGMAGKIDFGNGLDALFGDASGSFTKGQDAIFSATINGKTMDLVRSSNTVEMDGMTFTLKGEFGYKKDADGNFTDELDPTSEAVTFSSSADADKIVEAIKSMVEDYNAMVTEIKNAYSTLPMQRSSGSYYEPLTDDDKAGMSESAITAWEEKAKAGILFGDQALSSLYSRLTSAVSMTGQDGADLKAAGITINYSNGLTTLAFDENKLRATLETDPDRVTEIFTKNTEVGASSKGFLQALKEPLDLYGKTTGVNLSTGTKGVLVNKAGHPLAASTMYNNLIQQQLDSIDEEIDKWQDKMSNQVDYYTTQFSKLEQLIAQMNSQSSTLAGLMGG